MIAARREAGRLTGGVDTADLCRRRQQSTETQHEGRDDRRQCNRGLDRHRSPVVAQSRRGATLSCRGDSYTDVLSARSMIFVNALTMLSPVTTP